MKKQRKLRGLQRKKMVAGYLFIMPFILGFLAFMVKPFLQSLYMSFCNVEISSTGFHMIFAGMANYIRAFTIDTEFNRLLVEEIAKMTYNSLAIMVFSFFVALILNQKFKDASCCSCSEKTVTSDEKNRFFDFFEKVVDI